MPIYTYQCENCGERFEAKQSFADMPLTVCPSCEGKIHRVIQPVGVVFKGSGFYVTDSRGKQTLATSSAKKEDGKSTEGGSTTTTESSSTSTSDSKSDSKSDAKPAAEPAKSTSTTKE
jgi:putative FmdB family regulatory protein